MAPKKYNRRKVRKFKGKLVRMYFHVVRNGENYTTECTGVVESSDIEGITIKVMNEDPTLKINYQRIINIDFPYNNISN